MFLPGSRLPGERDLATRFDVTEEQAVDELRRKSTESRRRFLNNVEQSGTP